MFPYCEICERPIHDEWWAQSKFGNKRHVGCDQKVMVAESGDEPSDDLTRSVFIELVDDAFDKHVADDILEWHPQAVSCVTYMAEALADALGLADDDTGTDSPTADGGRESEPVGVGTRLPRPAGDLPTVGCDAPGCTNAAKHLWAPGDGTETYLCDAHAGPDGPTDDVVHDGSCVFCRIWEGTLSHKLVQTFRFENEPDVMAIVPLNPITPGHVIVIPENHVANVSEDPATSAATMRAAAILAKNMDSCNVITSQGDAATQTIRHLHVHVVPRRFGDGLALPWSGGSAVTPEDQARAVFKWLATVDPEDDPAFLCQNVPGDCGVCLSCELAGLLITRREREQRQVAANTEPVDRGGSE